MILTAQTRMGVPFGSCLERLADWMLLTILLGLVQKGGKKMITSPEFL